MLDHGRENQKNMVLDQADGARGARYWSGGTWVAWCWVRDRTVGSWYLIRRAERKQHGVEFERLKRAHGAWCLDQADRTT